uniref:Uncharacterized protein n=1 Tax=Rhizophora mucronata TaxID=61149 RepID=A0A2P2Q415_RHIMU
MIGCKQNPTIFATKTPQEAKESQFILKFDGKQ